MGAPFSDITLYTPTLFKVGTQEYREETGLINFVSDLYFCKMKGYKPPNTTRITIQPAFNKEWDGPWKNGSIVHIAPFFSLDEFTVLDKKEKYRYLLELIQVSVLQLSEVYQWDRTVFENAYKGIIDDDFAFKIDYPEKMSRDRKKTASLSIEKTETITALYVNIRLTDAVLKKKLFDKRNSFWYDIAYEFAKHSKWFDTNRFGVVYKNGELEVCYSIDTSEVLFFKNGKQETEEDFKRLFA